MRSRRPLAALLSAPAPIGSAALVRPPGPIPFPSGRATARSPPRVSSRAGLPPTRVPLLDHASSLPRRSLGYPERPILLAPRWDAGQWDSVRSNAIGSAVRTWVTGWNGSRLSGPGTSRILTSSALGRRRFPRSRIRSGRTSRGRRRLCRRCTSGTARRSSRLAPVHWPGSDRNRWTSRDGTTGCPVRSRSGCAGRRQPGRPTGLRRSQRAVLAD
jgi:hypothetical protein